MSGPAVRGTVIVMVQKAHPRTAGTLDCLVRRCSRFAVVWDTGIRQHSRFSSDPNQRRLMILLCLSALSFDRAIIPFIFIFAERSE